MCENLYCQGLKFCMNGRNTMLHGTKIRILPKNKILSLTAAHAAQFDVFQPHPWVLPSCKLKGFKFCMHGRNAASGKHCGFCHKTQIVGPTPMRSHFGTEHPNVAANHHTMACTLWGSIFRYLIWLGTRVIFWGVGTHASLATLTPCSVALKG